ncbi:hypothetical protein A2U01_0098072, partial [Trifolium medium]|nr:hypothetical protein [Trifolium medium]
VTTVRNRVIMLGIAKLQGPNHQQLQPKEADPPLEDVSTVWSLK